MKTKQFNDIKFFNKVGEDEAALTERFVEEHGGNLDNYVYVANLEGSPNGSGFVRKDRHRKTMEAESEKSSEADETSSEDYSDDK